MTSAPNLDSFSSRISASCTPDTRQILETAWHHRVADLKKLLDIPGKASSQDPATGETPLHAAIRACGPASTSEPNPSAIIESAKSTVYELFLRGAIWNDVDDSNETPGCLARRLAQQELYNLCVEAGVRAEMLFGLMEGYEELSSGSEDGDIGDTIDDGDVDEVPELVQDEAAHQESGAGAEAAEHEVRSENYLRSKLTYSEGKLVDDEGNGVMMAWETDIMQRSVDYLLPTKTPGKRILNIGFGMGIVDTMFRDTKPARHHIIEAHPEVLARIARGGSTFGTDWEKAGPEPGAFAIHTGKWQDICPKLLERGEIYDAIYFDTFGEDYGQLRSFFAEYIPGLLDENGIFGFFNGLGADRRICYDVYTKVVEMHLADAGLDVEWNEVAVDMAGMAEAGKGEWEGVKRRYWTLDCYRLPVCTFLG